MYIDLYFKIHDDKITDDYFRKANSFISLLDTEEKNVLISIIHQVMIDTSSNIFGIIDGITDIGLKENTVFLANNENKILSGDLQSIFLALDEEKNHD